jgi:cysteine-rich repeat protein
VEPVAQIVGSRDSFCALQQADGAIQCWGVGSNFGISGSLRSRTLAGPYVAIRSGYMAYCGQRDTGAWECFGVDDYGETQVPAGETFVELGPGGDHNCGIRPDGTVHCFGVDNYGQGQPPSEVDDVFVEIASGSWTTCGIRIDGRFECWGRYTDNDPQGSDRSLEPPGVCGDGVRDLSEACDDGDTVGGDGCSADCESDESCGNGQLDPGEMCDDYNQVDDDGCSNLCELGGGAPTCPPSGCVAPKMGVGFGVACYMTEFGNITCKGQSSALNDDVPAGNWTDLDLEFQLACALDDQGLARCWGAEGATADVAPAIAFDDVAVAQQATGCGIRSSDSHVECWGLDGFYNLVSDPAANLQEPVTALAGGGNSFCAVKASDGSLACWGSSSEYSGVPTTGSYTAIRGTGSAYCAREAGGTWACFGWDGYGQLQIPAESFVDVALGFHHGCGLRSDGTITCWGATTVTEDILVDYGQARPPGDTNADLFAEITGGWDTTCGFRLDGRAECWGLGTDNDPQTGEAYDAQDGSPMAFVSVEPPYDCGDGIRDLAEACDDGNQLSEDGCRADCESDETCGNGELDQTEVCDGGPGQPETYCLNGCSLSELCVPPQGQTVAELCEDGFECTEGVCDDYAGCSQVPSVDGTVCAGGEGTCRSGGCVVPKLAVGTDTACLIDGLGQMQCWGQELDIILDIPAGRTWVDIDLRDDVVCALETSGRARCWGRLAGSLADEAVAPLSEVAVGPGTACGIGREDSSIHCWGRNDFFELVSWPAANLSDPISDLGAGTNSFCAVKSLDGSLVCWGAAAEYAGLQGTGPYTAVRGMRNAFCAQEPPGTWLCGGTDTYGETVAPVVPFDDVATGDYHACGLASDGTVTCWGAGEAADPTGTNPHYGQSVPLSGLFDSLATGPFSTCGIYVDGTPACWGLGTSTDGNPLTTYLEPPP